MPEALTALRSLARTMGVATAYRDGLGRDVVAPPETLLHICAALGAPIERVQDATSALRAHAAERAADLVPPVLVAWDGLLDAVPVTTPDGVAIRGDLMLEDGSTRSAESTTSTVGFTDPIPTGYHQLRIETAGRAATCTVIAAPQFSWHPDDPERGWGVSVHLAALRSSRSRSVGDMADLRALCDWVGSRGGDLVSVLPLLPTFNEPPTEPSPYSPVSRLFWSELIIDLGIAHRPVGADDLLSVERAEAEVRAALEDVTAPGPGSVSDELYRYASFRGAQKRLGRDWQRWPDRQRNGQLGANDIDPDEQRFHLVAQQTTTSQLAAVRRHLDAIGVRLGLDLAVGVHPHGYDVWSRPDLFATDISVGAPPDTGFPSGQNWGFPPLLPQSSRFEGHAYFAQSVAHQSSLAGVLRIDHVMAMHRLYWIPEGMDLADGTYVHYPSEELFAILNLESHRNACVLVGEDLGTVPHETQEALSRHRIWGTYLAEFEAASDTALVPPSDAQVAMIDSHDTPTFAGWLGMVDVEERGRVGLLNGADAARERRARLEAGRALASLLGGDVDDPADLLSTVIEWLGRSASPLVVIGLEDLWLETQPVNIPGSTSTQRPNWQRPMRRSLDEAMADPIVARLLDLLDAARHADRNARARAKESG